MKPVVRLVFTAAAFTAALGIAGEALAAGTQLKTEKDKTSYMVGMTMARQLPPPVVDEIDPDMVAQAIKDVLTDKKPALSDDEAKDVGQAFAKKIQPKMKAYQQKAEAEAKAKAQAESAKNEKAGAAFMAKNKGKPGVKTTSSGLQYRVLKQGNGPKPKASDTVEVNYKGSLLDGTVFDSSYKRGEPATFPLNGVIPGWAEAIQLMPVGSKYEFWIPAKQAYGDRNVGPIEPGSTLHFEVELLKIVKQGSAKKSAGK